MSKFYGVDKLSDKMLKSVKKTLKERSHGYSLCYYNGGGRCFFANVTQHSDNEALLIQVNEEIIKRRDKR